MKTYIRAYVKIIIRDDENVACEMKIHRPNTGESVCMYVCMHVCVCMYACIYVCVCMYLCMHVFVCVCIYICTHVFMFLCMYVCMYVCIGYVCMYWICMYACMYVCKYLTYAEHWEGYKCASCTCIRVCLFTSA